MGALGSSTLTSPAISHQLWLSLDAGWLVSAPVNTPSVSELHVIGPGVGKALCQIGPVWAVYVPSACCLCAGSAGAQ